MFFNRILLATDGSPEARRASEMTVALSSRLSPELHVIHVGSVPGRYAAAESEILDYKFWKELREFAGKEASERLEGLVLSPMGRR